MAETPEETIKKLRELLARTYRAAIKNDYEEGECLNEVLSDVRWEGIDLPEMIGEGISQEPHKFTPSALKERIATLEAENRKLAAGNANLTGELTDARIAVERAAALEAENAEAERQLNTRKEQVEAMYAELAETRSPDDVSLGEALDVFLRALDGASNYRTWTCYEGDDLWALTLQRMAEDVLTPDKTIQSLRAQLAERERECQGLRDEHHLIHLPTRSVVELSRSSEESLMSDAPVSEEVLKAIASEKAYQESRWSEHDPGHPGQPANDRTIDEYALYTLVYAQKLAEVSSTTGDHTEILNFFRKVAALCVNAMEQHGAPQREGFEAFDADPEVNS